MEYAVLGCRAVLGMVFLAAAWSKVRDVAGFADTIRAIMRVRPAAAVPLARVVVGAEACVAVAVAAPWRDVVAGGFAVALGLSLGFAVVLGSALRRGIAEPCRCFGVRSGQRPVGVSDLVRDLVLVVAAGVGLAGGGRGASEIGGLVVAGAAGAVAGIVLIVLDDIVGLFILDHLDQATGSEDQWSSPVSS